MSQLDEKIATAQARIKELELLIRYWSEQKKSKE
tara:strand:+ start:238 stop:339 length:102 start_codon:yes stop_codon:yes gene_type:complete